MIDVDLHYIFACCSAGVFHLYGVGFEVAIGEGGVAEAVAEGVERLAGEKAVSAAFHAVVVKRREIGSGFVEGDGEAAGGVVVAEQDIGDGRASSLAGIPGFDNRGDVLGGPVDAD